MSIESSIIAENILQADGMRHITEKHTDHVGVVHNRHYTLQPGYDADALLLTHASILVVFLADREDNEAWNRIKLGEDALAVVQNPVHSTDRRIAKSLIYFMMAARFGSYHDLVRIIIRLEPLLVFLNSAFTDAQLRNFLDITQNQLNKMREKVKYILNVPAAADSVKGLIALADAESEEWE